MAGRRSPWGGGDKGGDQPGEAAGEVGDADEGKGAPEAESGGAEPPRGPRNPWLPPGGETPPRRSATIDDIFRGKDRRKPGGGGGGNFPRLPQRPDGKSWFPLIVGAIALLWIGLTMFHMVGPKEQGIVTTFGK